jgi:hypothetical protein
MAKDLTVVLEDRPGTLAALGEALGRAGVNIEGICGFTAAGKGIMHLLVEDAAAARSALADAGIEVRAERDVLVLTPEDRPGALGQIARKIASTGANIDVVYLATDTRIVIGADDLARARAALS